MESLDRRNSRRPRASSLVLSGPNIAGLAKGGVEAIGFDIFNYS
jgi:hypothetical protein